MKNSDIVIVGGGLGGLTAGATLAKLGHRVVLLEQHYVPGGCATTFKRKDYLMEVGLHEMDGLDSVDGKTRMFDFLGLGDDVQFLQVPELYQTTLKHGNYVLPHGEEEAKGYLCQIFPEETKAIEGFFALITGARAEIERIPRGPILRRLLFPLFPVLFPNTVKSSRMTLSDYLNATFENEDLKLLLIANLVYYHDNPDTMSLFYFAVAQAGYIQGGGHFVKGGSQQLSNRLADIIRENGGLVLLGKRVTEIHTNRGRVTGVAYRDAFNKNAPAETVDTDQVIANAAVPLVADLLPEPEGTKLRCMIADLEIACSLLSIYIGFNTDLKKLGSRHYSSFIGQDRIDKLSDFNTNCHADFDKRSFVFVDYGQIDSGLSPDGKTFGCICCADYLTDWDNLSPTDYAARKEQVADALFKRLDAFLPGARDAIEHYEVGTAKTVQSYTLNPGGTAYGFAQTSDQAGNKRFGRNTPVRGLSFASAWGFPGGGFTGAIIGGFLTAQDVAKQANKSGEKFHAISDARSVRFVHRKMVAKSTFEIAFDKPAGFAAKPGQYAFVTLDNPRYTSLDVAVRPLSIVSSPDEDIVRFAMHISDTGFKQSCLAMDTGDSATLYGPTGEFLLPEQDMPIVFLAGGVGITPILPMVESLRAKGFPCKTHVVYSARTKDAMAYHDVLSNISHDNYTFHSVLTGKEPRLDAVRLHDMIKTPEDFRFYLVGTGGFLTSMKDVLTSFGVAAEQMVIDDFG